MTPPTTRRAYLGALGILAGAGTLGATPTSAAEPPCPAFPDVEEPSAAVERIRSSEIPELRASIDRAREQWRAEQHRLPAATRKQALDVGTAARESVVYLQVEYAGGADIAISTAWYVTEDRLLTNAHNVDDARPADTIAGYTLDGRRMTCEILGLVDGRTPDVALLATDVPGTPLPTADPASLEAGTTLVQVGHPGDMGNWVITAGEFLDWIGWDDPEAAFETTVSGMGGNSGSPTLTLDGEVVGMLYGGRRPRNPPPETPGPSPLTVETAPLASQNPGGEHVAIDVALDHAERWSA